MRRFTNIVALGIFAVAAMATLIVTTGAMAQNSPAEQVVLMPASWVPFSADIYRDGNLAGRFHRSRDGSTMVVLHSASGDIITIHNVKLKRSYVRFGDRGWAELPFGGQVLVSPEPVFRPRGMTRSTERIAGMDVWHLRAHSEEATSKVVPHLNGFVVYRHTQTREGSTHTEEYRKVKLGEPASDAFLPPQDVEIQRREGPKFLR